MMQNTPKFNFELPELQDTVSPDPFNRNFTALENLVGAAGGIAALDETGKVDPAQMPEMDYIPTEQKGAPNGVAPLNDSGVVALEDGGTGKSSWAANRLVYASAETTLNQLAAGTSGQVLTSAGASAPYWSTPKGSLRQVHQVTASLRTVGQTMQIIPSGLTLGDNVNDIIILLECMSGANSNNFGYATFANRGSLGMPIKTGTYVVWRLIAESPNAYTTDRLTFDMPGTQGVDVPYSFSTHTTLGALTAGPESTDWNSTATIRATVFINNL